ncbi:MAG: peptidylprolyl isomerase [Bacteroidales bacterium]
MKLLPINISLLFFLVSVSFFSYSQDIIVDEVVAVVGDEMIKKSDVRNQYMQLEQSNNSSDANMCEIFEDLLFSKLLLTQAKIDSIEVSESEIDSEIERRVNMFTNQEGGLERLQEMYGKSSLEIKTEWRPLIREQIMVDRMRNSIVEDVQVTPNEVRTFYENLPTDSLPTVESKYEYAHIVFSPQVSKQEEERIKTKLGKIRERILSGEKFDKLAVLYSDDQESANNGGLLGEYMSRGELLPEFSAVAFRLEEGEVSQIVKTEFGYHIILMVERKGQKAKLKHILMRPRTTPASLEKTASQADSVYGLLQNDSISFERAAKLYSSDKNTKNNGGVFMNPYTGTSKFSVDMLEPSVLRMLKKMEDGEISEPFLTHDNTGARVYKMVKLLKYEPEHTASLVQDYDVIKQMAMEQKKSQVMKNWVEDHQQNVYIQFMSESFSDCSFTYPGWR